MRTKTNLKTLLAMVLLLVVLGGNASGSATASNPSPADGAVGVKPSVILSWVEDDYAVSRDIYFGTNEAAVTDANTANTATYPGVYRGSTAPVDPCDPNRNTYDPPELLDLLTEAFWRIDEINGVVAVKGDIWSFTSAPYFVVDDFEPYLNLAALTAVWTTGHLTDNGAQLSLETVPDYIRDGDKSMEFAYRNAQVGGLYNGSEAVANTSDLQSGWDWTRGGAKALALYFYGDAGNAQEGLYIGDYHITNDQMYVALEDGSAEVGIVKYDKKYNHDMNDIKEPFWHEWNIDLQDPCLAAVDMNNVAKVYIGFGGQKTGQSAGGAGTKSGKFDTVWFDDIELWPPRCLSEKVATDFTGDCVVDYSDLEIMARDWLTEPCLEFYQSNFVLDGNSFTDTNNGAVDLTYTGTSNVRYFNLAIDDDWVIQNVPVLSQEGIGVSHTKTYSFPLDVPSGTPVEALLFDYRLTDGPIQEMPDGTMSAPVADRQYIISSGIAEAEIPVPSPLKKLIGHLITGPEHSNAGFESSDCNESECVPAAVSDSMNFLNEEHDMGLDESDIDIDDMKDATNWGEKDIGGGKTATGAWIDHDDNRAEGEQNAWWEDKDEYMQENDIPVTTRKVEDLGELGEELDEGQDVELQGDWHTAAITGITDLGNGDYAIDVSHDTKQGEEGGVQTDTIIYDSDTGEFIGSPGFFDGSSLRYAVVECPEEPSASTGGAMVTEPDITGDGKVNFLDYALMAKDWLKEILWPSQP